MFVSLEALCRGREHLFFALSEMSMAKSGLIYNLECFHCGAVKGMDGRGITALNRPVTYRTIMCLDRCTAFVEKLPTTMLNGWNYSILITHCAADFILEVSLNNLGSIVLVPRAVVDSILRVSVSNSRSVCRATRIDLVSILLRWNRLSTVDVEFDDAFETFCSPRGAVAWITMRMARYDFRFPGNIFHMKRSIYDVLIRILPARLSMIPKQASAYKSA